MCLLIQHDGTGFSSSFVSRSPVCTTFSIYFGTLLAPSIAAYAHSARLVPTHMRLVPFQFVHANRTTSLTSTHVMIDLYAFFAWSFRRPAITSHLRLFTVFFQAPVFKQLLACSNFPILSTQFVVNAYDAVSLSTSLLCPEAVAISWTRARASCLRCLYCSRRVAVAIRRTGTMYVVVSIRLGESITHCCFPRLLSSWSALSKAQPLKSP
jgi:hypothetical protein